VPGPGSAAAVPCQVVGPVLSPLATACGQLVQCGEGQLLVLEVESEDGEVLSGRSLCEQDWTGLRWG